MAAGAVLGFGGTRVSWEVAGPEEGGGGGGGGGGGASRGRETAKEAEAEGEGCANAIRCVVWAFDYPVYRSVFIGFCLIGFPLSSIPDGFV